MTEKSLNNSRPDLPSGDVTKPELELSLLSDETLMSNVSEGDDFAWKLLVTRYEKRIYNFFIRIGHDRGTAEDLLQLTFLKVFQARKNYEVKAAFSTWIFTIANRLSIDEFRRRARQPEHEFIIAEVDQNQTDDHSPEKMTAQQQMKARVHNALASLPEGIREAVILGKFEGYSYAEIASILECSISAVTVRIHRGLKTLRENLEVDNEM